MSGVEHHEPARFGRELRQCEVDALVVRDADVPGMIGKVIVMEPDEYQAWLGGAAVLAFGGVRAIDGLLCAASSPGQAWGGRSAVNLPALTISLADMSSALARVAGPGVSAIMARRTECREKLFPSQFILRGER